MAHTVLIVDGEPMVRRSLGLLLESHGFQVAMARNAPQAMAAFPKVDPDAVLVEVGMSAKGVVETIDEMRRLKPGTKIVGMDQKTLLADLDLPSSAEDFGVDAVIAKPFEAEDLLHVLHDQLLPAHRVPELELALA
jgi:CheY-like chemotaxis protein